MNLIGVIGYGYCGPNLVRNFSENDNFQVMGSDLKPNNLFKVNKRYPSIQTQLNFEDVIHPSQMDAVAILLKKH